MSRVGSLLLGAALVLTACSGARDVASSAAGTGQSPAAANGDPPTSASNATKAATRLLALVVVPLGARKIAASSSLVGGPFETDNDPQQVDVGQSWVITQPIAVALAFLVAHPPSGLTLSGHTSGQAPGETSEGIDYYDPASGGQIQVEVATHTHLSTDIRADAVVSWRDPNAPVIQDTEVEARVRLSVAGGCPPSLGSTVGVTNSGPGLTSALIPAGMPTAALVCEYDGLPSPKLADAVHDDAGQAQALAAAIRAVPLLRHGDLLDSLCPDESGAEDVLALSFRGRADVDVSSEPGAAPCGGSANGVVEGKAGVSLPVDPSRPAWPATWR